MFMEVMNVWRSKVGSKLNGKMEGFCLASHILIEKAAL